MKATNNETMAIFHIGRGGRFNNGGHLEFIQLGTIDDAERLLGDNVFVKDEREDDTELLRALREEEADAEQIAEVEARIAADEYREPYYVDGGGNEVGEVGGGHYDFDGAYDTLYVSRLDDLSDAEKTAICENAAATCGAEPSLACACAELADDDQLHDLVFNNPYVREPFERWCEGIGIEVADAMYDGERLREFINTLA